MKFNLKIAIIFTIADFLKDLYSQYDALKNKLSSTHRCVWITMINNL